MERYSEYKDSGVQWLGVIPKHWTQFQFRKFFKIKKVIAGKEGFDVLAITQQGIRIKDITRNEGQLAANYSGYQIVNPSDFAMNHMDLITGYIDISKFHGVTSPDYRVFTNISKEADSKYYLYIFQLCYKRKIFFGLGQGVANKGRWRLPAAQLNKFCLPLPPLSEQRSIVSYLDDKCTKIDKMLEGKQKQIELLAEMKQRIIADAVTRGLNPNVKMKATNIPWLPEIPEHWEQESLRKFLKIVSIKNKPDKQLLSVTREQGVIIRDVDSKQENHNYIPVDLSGYKYVEVGDFCINKMKSWQGSYGVSDYEGIVSPAYYICKLSGVYKPFFNHAIRSKYYVAFFAQYSKGIRVDQWDLSPIGLKSIPFFLPPLSEQQAIVSHITERSSKIETLTQKLQQEIESIKEYKQRLISDVVTGQIKVC